MIWRARPVERWALPAAAAAAHVPTVAAGAAREAARPVIQRIVGRH